MKPADAFEFPPEQQQALKKARRLAWWTLAYLGVLVVLLYFVMGSSQAMRATWIEDMLSMIPPIVFLVASYAAGWKPNRRHPYGYHRAVSVAFLVAAVTLCMVGGVIFAESVYKLATAEHPTIGGVKLFGHVVWLGWLMYPVLLWKVVPAVLLGRAKLPLAEKMHDKVLHTDANMNKADWKTGLVAIVGVTGIGLGWWWADAVAAILISIDILADGFLNLREVVRRLMDEHPRTVEREPDLLPKEVRDWLLLQPWVEDAAVRLREEGHVHFGEAFVIPRGGRVDVDTLEETGRRMHDLDWRLHEIVLVPVKELSEFSSETSDESHR
jgi:cation diffusion facilitator family transporter